ncbi:MAG TPA: S8 family serine peptidase, partial [Rudaea sp.]|nr:S8 family serine peptidase [Rudaea sp.]
GSNPGLDHTLYLYQNIATSGTANWSNVAVSSTPNNVPNSLPQQDLQYTASGGATGGCPAHSAVYAIAVTKNIGVPAGTNYNLQVFATTDDDIPINYRVAARSLDFPADSPNVLSVAAIDVANATTTPQEPFSSEGPVLATGGGLPVNPNPLTDTNLKPDVASFDNVTTVTYGAGGKDPPLATAFFGTSASTPHVAGMAALFMERFGIPTSATNLTNNIITPLRTIASTGANDLGTVGKDYSYGYGRLKFQQDAGFKFLQQPTNTVAGATITPSVKVEVIDTAGIADPYTLYTYATLAIGTNPGGGTLTGGGMTALTAGAATFSGLHIDKAGTGYTLVATSTPTGLMSSSNAFNITAGTATHLAFLVQPSNVQAGKPVTPTVQVAVEDASGNVVSTASASITLRKTTCNTVVPTGGGPVSTVGGVASFPNLTLNTVANAVVLQASVTSGFSAITSSPFNVTGGDTIFANGFEAGCVP